MITAAGQLDGQSMLVIGLSGENMTRLMAGEPVLFHTAPLGLPAMAVVVVGGRTEDDIQAELKQHLSVVLKPPATEPGS